MPRLLRLTLNSLCALLIVQAAHADFNEGFSAYEKGDYETALKEWTPAAKTGDPYAQHMLGFLYAHGRGVPINPEKTVELWTIAAEQGFAPAQYTLGSLYRKGLGVNRNQDEAVKWISRAADSGHPDAQYAFGMMHAVGDGVLQDLSMSFMWLSLAAEARGLATDAFWKDVDEFLNPVQRLEADQLRKTWSQ